MDQYHATKLQELLTDISSLITTSKEENSGSPAVLRITMRTEEAESLLRRIIWGRKFISNNIKE